MFGALIQDPCLGPLFRTLLARVEVKERKAKRTVEEKMEEENGASLKP
jgi:hypothetical protein